MATPHDPATDPVATQHGAGLDADPDGDFLDEEWLEPRRSSQVTKVLVGLLLVALGFLAGVTVGRGAAGAAAGRSAAGPMSVRSPGGGGGGQGTQSGGGSAGSGGGGGGTTGGAQGAGPPTLAVPNGTGARGSGSPSATRSAGASAPARAGAAAGPTPTENAVRLTAANASSAIGNVVSGGLPVLSPPTITGTRTTTPTWSPGPDSDH